MAFSDKVEAVNFVCVEFMVSNVRTHNVMLCKLRQEKTSVLREAFLFPVLASGHLGFT